MQRSASGARRSRPSFCKPLFGGARLYCATMRLKSVCGGHSITLSARSSTDTGIAIPSIRAALRLTTSSSLVG